MAGSYLDTLDNGKKETLVKTWMGYIEDALKREKTFRGHGQKVVNLYEAKSPDDTPFAIVYSNTEVLQPALYNQKPIPIVSRRFKDEDPVGKAAAETSTRILKFLIDTEAKDYDNFDELIQAGVLNALLVNRGVTRFKYVAHESAAYSECVYGEDVRWDKFFHGYARSWKKVPWIGFEWDMTKEEVEDNFPDISPLDFRNMTVDAQDDSDNKAESTEQLTGVTVYKVYEIWDKASGKVMFFSGVSSKSPLRVVDDPLGLSGFFPVPRPLNFMKKVTTLTPTPLYEQYRQQAQELNELTRRLKAIIKAIKFRGAYNAAVEGIEKMLAAEDNELVPVQNVQSMPDGTGMDKLIWTVPVDELVQSAQSLYQQRESCKQVIYEITGISDILRGASVASETATAQQLKNQWGSLRLRKMQKEVQRYCRESLAIMLEIAAMKFEPKTVQQMTGLPYMFDSQKQMVKGQIQQATMRATTMAQMTGQPPQPPQIPPELQALIAQPSWDQILKLLHNDVARAYKTDIETNSTIDAEASQDKQDIAELLNALSQFLNGVSPLVESGVMPMGVAKEILLVISRRFNFGSNLESMLEQMKEPPPKTDPNAEADKAAAAAQLQQTQAESAAAAQKAKLQMAMDQAEFEQKKELMVLQGQLDRQALEIKRAELELQQKALGMKLTVQNAQHDQKMKEIANKGKEKAETD